MFVRLSRVFVDQVQKPEITTMTMPPATHTAFAEL